MSSINITLESFKEIVWYCNQQKRLFAILAISVAVCFSNGNANVGDYCSEDKNKCLQLKPDGKFVYIDNKERFFGTYAVECDELSIIFDGIDEKSFSERVEREKKYRTENFNKMIEQKCGMAALLGIPLEDFNGKRYSAAQIKQCINDYENIKTVKQTREGIKTMKLDEKDIKEIIREKNEYFPEALIYKNSILLGGIYLTNGSAVDYPHKYYCSNGVLKKKEEFTDSRDGKKYAYVTIGKQTWMAENLNYHGKDGYLGLCKNEVPENCEKYGREYDWSEAMSIDRKYNEEKWGSINWPWKKAKNHQGICPEGWHLPSDKEWETLIKFAGGDEIAGKKFKVKMKSQERSICKYTTKDDRGRVTEHDECPTDEYGFSASGCFFIPLEGIGKPSYLEEEAAQGLCFSENGNGVDITWDIIRGAGTTDTYCLKDSYGSHGSASMGCNWGGTTHSLGTGRFSKKTTNPVRCVKD